MKKPYTPTPEQKLASDARREQFNALVKTFADFTDEEREKLATTLGGVVNTDGHKFSTRNTWMVKAQKPHASIVGTFAQWVKMGRMVNKGEKSAMIAVPLGQRDPATGAITKVTGFASASVFDISQTKELEKKMEVAA